MVRNHESDKFAFIKCGSGFVFVKSGLRSSLIKCGLEFFFL
jgi:hypothetical protein